jgi:hypothetical protein
MAAEAAVFFRPDLSPPGEGHRAALSTYRLSMAAEAAEALHFQDNSAIGEEPVAEGVLRPVLRKLEEILFVEEPVAEGVPTLVLERLVGPQSWVEPVELEKRLPT